jgi:hypothetical protein
MSESFNRKSLNKNPLPPSMRPTKAKQHVMDDITHGQWSKKQYDDDDNNYIQSDDILDPYSMQKNFRKMANKLSRSL